MMNIQGVILAAGKGKRMRSETPKPLVEISGKPMISHLLKTLESIDGIPTPIVVVSPSGEQLFKDTIKSHVQYAVQPEALGTGDAVRASEGLWSDAVGVMVLYADHPFIPQGVLTQIMTAFLGKPDAVHMLTARVPSYENEYEPFKNWARIIRDENKKIISLREVKDASDEEKSISEVNPGIYIFPTAWLRTALERIKNENASGEYYLTDVMHIAKEDGIEIESTQTDALAVIGLNTPEDILIAESLHKSM